MEPKKHYNRYNNCYWFEPIGKDLVVLKGDLTNWRFGGKAGQVKLDTSDLGFVDPSGGPWLAVGGTVEGRDIVKIELKDEQILLHLGAKAKKA